MGASCTADEKELILQSFDLDKFTAKELVDYVRKTEFYADEEIDRRLSYALNQYEEEARDLKKQVADISDERSNLEKQIFNLKNQLNVERSQTTFWKSKYEIEIQNVECQ